MKIFLKYVIKSMLEKKGRFVLLILAIAISTGLLVASSGTVQIAINSFTRPMKESVENKEIVITPKDKSQFFKLDDINEYGVKDIQSELVVAGSIPSDDDQTCHISIRGREDKYINNDIITQGSTENFTGNECIISDRISKEKDLNLNDTITISIGGEKKDFKITAISSNNGLFYGDKTTSFKVIVPYSYLSKEINQEGKYNYVVANKTLSTAKDSIDEFDRNNTVFQSSVLIDEDAIKSQTSNFTNLLNIMLVIVILMSTIIIYGSFKLTITERISTIGTFLSQGASLSTIEKILCFESILYGILGAILGNILGTVGLYYIGRLASPLSKYGIYEKFNIEWKYIAIGFAFAVALSLFSAILPILKIRRLQVKEVILNNVNISMELKWTKFIIGVILLAICIVINYSNTQYSVTFSGIILLASLVGLIFIFPKIVDIVSSIICYLIKSRSKSLFFAFNNLRTSKVLLGNITLIIISLLSIVLISSASSSVKAVVSEAYLNLDYDIDVTDLVKSVGQTSTTDKVLNILNEENSVDQDSINKYAYDNASIDDKNFYINAIIPDTFKNYNQYLELSSDKNKQIYDDFSNDSKDKIIISDTVKKAISKNVGDTVTLKINDIEKEYKIAGVINGKMYFNGNFGLINFDDLKNYFKINEASAIEFKTSKSQEDARTELIPKLKDLGVTINTRDEEMQQNIEDNKTLMTILSVFSYMAIIIASLGVFNNITIGFLQRKRELAILSSVGMGNLNRSVMLLTESILSVFWAIVFTLPFCPLAISILENLLKFISMPIKITFDIKSTIFFCGACFVIIIIASIPVLFKSRKLSVIEELKYE